MTIDIPVQTATELATKAQAEGISIGAYLERLLLQEDSRKARLEAFRRAIEEREASLSAGNGVDGEEVMGRLIAELGPPGQASGTH
jgi:hypothetical protein